MEAPPSLCISTTHFESYRGAQIVERRRRTADDAALYAAAIASLGISGSEDRRSAEGVHEHHGQMFRVFAVRTRSDWMLNLTPVQDSVPGLATLGVHRLDLLGLIETPGLTLICSGYGSGKTATQMASVGALSPEIRGRTCYVQERPEFHITDQYACSRIVGLDVQSVSEGLDDAVAGRYLTIAVDAVSCPEAARSAVMAASLGHRVIATISADSALSGVRRLYSLLDPDDHRRVPRALAGIWAQRLLIKGGTTYLLHESVRADSAFCRVLGGRRIEQSDVVEAIRRQGRLGFWDVANKHIRAGAFHRVDALQVLTEDEVTGTVSAK